MPVIVDPTDPSGLGRALREQRRSLRLTQLDLADLSGVSERFVRELERGKTTVQLDKVLTVMDTLGLTLSLVERVRDNSSSSTHALDPANGMSNGNA